MSETNIAELSKNNLFEMENSNQKIVGVWRLESYLLTLSSGKNVPLWGDNPDGAIIYLENGFMSVHVSDQDRPKFVANDFLAGTVDEIKRAFEGYTAYFGTYEYDSNKGEVLHHVLGSLYPNWSGITQKRFIQCNDNKLVITTPPIIVSNEDCIMEMRWVRV